MGADPQAIRQRHAFCAKGQIVIKKVYRVHNALRNAFLRYEMTHLALSGEKAKVVNRLGETVGHIDRVQLSKGRLHVAGWALAQRVRLVLGGAEDEEGTFLHRPDVAAALGCRENVGFELSVPANPQIIATSQAPGVVFTAGPDQPDINPVSLSIRPDPWQSHRLRLRFFRDVVSSLPSILNWYLTGKPVHRARVKARLRLNEGYVSLAMATQLFQVDGKRPPEVRKQTISIVLPVYNAFELLRECIDRVERHTDLLFRLIMIEDCSTDPRIRPFLTEWAGSRDFVTLLTNAENLGFIGSVNRGLREAMSHDGQSEGPVVLLNSDALVPENWASRLVRPFQNHLDVASVTPMSNDAEIMTVPVICKRNVLKPGQADMIDRLAQRFAPDAQLSVVPTGVGFCMAMGRDWLARVGQLDTRFGRGYGEEVDWCRKVAAMGGRHLALPGLFVEHRGGESFGNADKQALIARHGLIISRRYPDFDQSVHDFIVNDPLNTARLALGLAWAGSLSPDEPVPVCLAHSLGGGADIHLEHWMRSRLDKGLPSVVLRVGGKRRWRLELVTAQGRTCGQTDDFEFVARLLAILPRRQIVYSCGVGDRDPVQLPALMLALMRPQDSARMLFHDFFPLSPSYTLLDSDAIYRGPVKASRSDKAHRTVRPDGTGVSLSQWQAAWRCFAERAELEVFSLDSARQVRAAWPELGARITVRPHSLTEVVTPVVVPAGAPPVVGVLGNIGLQKGAAVLGDLVHTMTGKTDAPKCVLIGNIDPAYALPQSVRQHGSYAIRDLPHLIGTYGITHWLIPSIWPETFCYTVHEALATGLPVMAFDIGAQGDAVRTAPNGIAIPFGDGRGLAGRIAATLCRMHSKAAPDRQHAVLSLTG